jgi:hypothetical protein
MYPIKKQGLVILLSSNNLTKFLIHAKTKKIISQMFQILAISLCVPKPLEYGH